MPRLHNIRTGKGAPGKKARKPAQGATRKIAVKSKQRQASPWLSRIMILAGIGAVLALATQGFVTLHRIPVQQITVTGELAYTQTEAVQDMVQSNLAGGFLRADLQRIREQLEGLPWIFEATVRRKWPSSLEIHVVEQLPIARWGEDGFLNHEGQAFHSTRGGDWQSLPLLRGPQGTASSLMANYQRMLELLSPLGLKVVQLAVDERGQVQAVLAGGLELVVGNQDFLERMHRFVALYRAELAARAEDIERVDLRYESGVAVAYSAAPEFAALQQHN